VQDNRKNATVGLEEDIEHGFGSHAHTKGCGITTVTQHQPIKQVGATQRETIKRLVDIYNSSIMVIAGL
jgi:hypothetical protein